MRGSITFAPKANEVVKRRLNERNSSILQMDQIYRYYLAALKSSRACFKCPPQTLKNRIEFGNALTRSNWITYAKTAAQNMIICWVEADKITHDIRGSELARSVQQSAADWACMSCDDQGKSACWSLSTEASVKRL